MQKEAWLYVGVDESNNGRFPVIYTATFSRNPQDVEPQRVLLPKKRRNHGRLMARFSGKKYSFLLFSQSDQDRVERVKIPGLVIASLIDGEDLENTLDLYIDGILDAKSQDYIIDYASRVSEISNSNISISCGPEHDQRFSLVNIADETAHFLLQKSLNTLREDSRMKNLLLRLL